MADKNSAEPPAPYCDSFRYDVDSHGVVTFRFGKNGAWQSAVAIPAVLARELALKVIDTLNTQEKPKAVAEQIKTLMDAGAPARFS